MRKLMFGLALVAAGSGAGSTVYPVEFTNLSDHACTLYGFPGVSAESAGHQVGSAAQRDHAVPAQTVTLGPRGTAHAQLRITDVSAIPPAACKPVTADGLTVYPPGAFTAAEIPFRFRACSATGPSFLSVQTVQPPLRHQPVEVGLRTRELPVGGRQGAQRIGRIRCGPFEGIGELGESVGDDRRLDRGLVGEV